MTVLSALTAVLWALYWLLPWRPWRAAPVFAPRADAPARPLDDIVVLIPARNEADTLPATLAALARQGPGLRVVLTDDGSSDGTADVARGSPCPALTVIRGEERPAGWSGKLWALEQARAQADRPLVLLLDADIVLQPGTVAALRDTLQGRGLGLVSLMAELSMGGLWERALLPAFVHFFMQLYPFRLVASPRSRVAAAAGGCVLLRRQALEDIGGFAALRGAIIDDCTLARRVKDAGHAIAVYLTHAARSQRRAAGLGDIHDMVARTAYAQLGYRLPLLIACTAGLLLAYVAPPTLLATAPGPLALAAWTAMTASYVDTLRFYRRSLAWALALPAIAGVYLLMTWSSAARYWRGEHTRWKGRSYRDLAPGG